VRAWLEMPPNEPLVTGGQRLSFRFTEETSFGACSSPLGMSAGWRTLEGPHAAAQWRGLVPIDRFIGSRAGALPTERMNSSSANEVVRMAFLWCRFSWPASSLKVGCLDFLFGLFEAPVSSASWRYR
jgi:hypothetical protein